MKADKLASFRVDSQLWEQFQAVAKENNTTASALLVAYIKQVVSPDNVNTSNLAINTSSDNPPTLSIHDIDSRIDEKISQSIQDINTPSIQNIEDLIDSRIKQSIADGDIRYAIAHSYQSSANQFNEMIGELQQQIGELQKQFEELQSVPPSAAPVPPSAIDNSPSAIDSPAPELEIPPNDMQNIRSTLNRKKIRVRADDIRQAFYVAGWNGNNFQAIRKDILEILSGGARK